MKQKSEFKLNQGQCVAITYGHDQIMALNSEIQDWSTVMEIYDDLYGGDVQLVRKEKSFIIYRIPCKGFYNFYLVNY